MVKKKLTMRSKNKCELVEIEHPFLSVRRQCELLGLNRSSYYYRPGAESDLNLKLMKLIDEQYLKMPFYGYRKMTAHLRRSGYPINFKRVRRLMNLMGIQAIAPKPRTSIPGKGHKIYPYLLRNVKITRPNQVWSTDITYIPMRQGFMYLVAVMDWYSRYVLSWEVSNTLDGAFCLDALNSALEKHGKPEIFNTDQGVQFTADIFTERLKDAEIKISMDGRGRFVDNIFIERLWRSVKYEQVYLHEYETGFELMADLASYFDLYNHERVHQSLNYQTPAEVYGVKMSNAVSLVHSA